MNLVDYTGMKNKERDNIMIKLRRRARCHLTTVRADTVLPSTSISWVFFTGDTFWRSRYRWMTAELIILVFHIGKQGFFLRTHVRFDSKYVLIVRGITKLTKTILLLLV